MCTHHQPNGLQVIQPGFNYQFQSEKIWRVTLGDNYLASAKECEAPGKCEGVEISGTWTNIYDQAQHIELSNGMRFIANYRYNMNEMLVQ